VKPSIGRIVHYVSYGTPGGEYTSQCRAAIIAGLDEHPEQNEPGDVFASLVVLNPTGMFFNQMCLQDEQDKTGGTWHWPERVEEEQA
jgi:hypothetical protein